MNKRQTFLITFFWFLSLGLFAQDQWKNVYSKGAWTARDKWQKADELIRQLNLKPDRKSVV